MTIKSLLFLSFTLLGTTSIRTTFGIKDLPTLRQGKDQALFFAINDYDEWHDLHNSISSAEAIAKELQEQYAFETEIIKNPSQEQIFQTLNRYIQKSYASDGQLFIYFSGHGEFIEATKEGFFIPRDGKKNDLFQTSYVPHARLQRIISQIPCKHILLSIDACFSGTFDDQIALSTQMGDKDKKWKRFGDNEEKQKQAWIEARLKYKSRLYLTSGGKEQTSTGVKHSPFSRQLLNALRSLGGDDGVLTYTEILPYLEKASPEPKSGQFEGDDGGSFLFIWKPNTINSAVSINKEKDQQAWEAAQRKHTIAAYHQYISAYPQGIYQYEVRQHIKELEDDLDWRIAANKKTKAAYQSYLNAHPRGSNASVARRNIAKLDKLVVHDDRMIFVKGGTFTMGCTAEQEKDCYSDEKPWHDVNVGDFYISKYEVTNTEFCQFLNEKGNQTEGGATWLEMDYSEIEKSGERFQPKSGFEQHPVVSVSWFGAVAYCQWKNKKSRQKYRLPTEAEWEYAARGGNNSQNYIYSGSISPYKVAWHYLNSGANTHPVGEKMANELGLYDMSGNVYEWCSDWYGEKYYKNSPQNNPTGPESGTNRVVRDGSWNSAYFYQRVSNRGNLAPSSRSNDIGFRISRQPRKF